MVADNLVVATFPDGGLILTLENDYGCPFDLVFANGACRFDDPLWKEQFLFLSRISEIVNKQGGIERK